jgi:hypothetical protein
MKFLIVQLLSFSCHLSPLRSKYSSQNQRLLSIYLNSSCLCKFMLQLCCPLNSSIIVHLGKRLQITEIDTSPPAALNCVSLHHQ